jgi:WD40 repeat protein
VGSRIGAPDAAIVRILNGAGRPVGAGCLVGPRQVLTCAHVVTRALGLPDSDTASAPQDHITVDFPLVAPGKPRVGQVDVWMPIQPDETGDVAGLVLTEPAPSGTAPARLVMAEDVWDHPFRAFGFPPGRDTGQWARGLFLSRGTNGLIQADDDRNSGFSIGPGFSGTPVWDEQDGGVAGIAVASEAHPSARTSYILPMQTLVELWPVLGSPSVARCPYRGLDPFLEDHKEHFHGREDLTKQLVERIRQSSLTVVVGPSGSGKSSLVFAGALPILRDRADLAITSCRPSGGETPLAAIAGAMVELREPGMTEPQRLNERLEFTKALNQGRFFDVVDQVLRSAGKQRLLLIIDQFEELFTLDPPERNAFLDLIARESSLGADVRSRRVCVVLTLRADFLTYALEHAGLAAALTDSRLFVVGPMTREQLREAIEKPAAGVARYQPGLVDRILDGVGSEPGNLPLLEFALTLLWGKLSRATLTHGAYEELGKVAGALANHAEQVYQTELGAQEKKIRGLLAQLIHAGETTGPTRRLAHRMDVGEQRWAIAQVLATNRLAVIDRDHKNGSQDTVELAHEALITAWDRLREWIDNDREFFIWQERLLPALSQWRGSGRKWGTLLTGLPLAEAERWLLDRPDDLGPEQREFIYRSRRKRRRVISGLVALSMVLVMLLSVAVWQSVVVQRQRDVAAAQRLASEAEVNVDQHPLSLLLSLESLRLSPTDEARATLLQGVLQPRNNVFAIIGHTATVYAATFSSDGRMIVSASRDGALRLWDASTGKPIGKPLITRGGTVRGAAFNPDGTMVASAHRDGAVRRWDTGTGSPIGEPMRGHTLPVEGVAFSPAGHMIASVSEDGMVRRWNADTGAPIGEPMVGHRDQVEGVAFSPDGRMIASASEDGTVRRWNADTGAPIGEPMVGHRDQVEGVAFSPDGRMIASASEDGTVRRWNADTGAPIGEPMVGHRDQVEGVAFSPDGKLIASASLDHTVRLWDNATGQSIGQPLAGHTDWVESVAFSPDGKGLASASEDGTVRRWEVETGPPIGQLLSGHTAYIWTVAFSPDRRMIATASEDGTARLWDATTGQFIRQLTGHDGTVQAVAFSPDSKVVASAGLDRTVRLWDTMTGQPVGQPLRGHTDWVFRAVFSPDGRTIASASRDGTVRRWDVVTGQQIGEPLTGHTSEVTDVVFSPDSKMIASASRDGTVRRWDVVTGQQIGEPLTGHAGEVVGVVFSPDGKMIASASRDGTVRRWSSGTGEQIGPPLTGRPHEVLSVAFNPDGKVIASVSSDGTVQQWESVTSKPISQPLGRFRPVAGAAFSPDGALIAVAIEQTVRLWPLDMDEWVRHACALAGRNLRQEEWDEFIGRDRPYVRTCPELPSGHSAPTDAPAAKYELD